MIIREKKKSGENYEEYEAFVHILGASPARLLKTDSRNGVCWTKSNIYSPEVPLSDTIWNVFINTDPNAKKSIMSCVQMTYKEYTRLRQQDSCVVLRGKKKTNGFIIYNSVIEEI